MSVGVKENTSELPLGGVGSQGMQLRTGRNRWSGSIRVAMYRPWTSNMTTSTQSGIWQVRCTFKAPVMTKRYWKSWQHQRGTSWSKEHERSRQNTGKKENSLMGARNGHRGLIFQVKDIWLWRGALLDVLERKEGVSENTSPLLGTHPGVQSSMASAGHWDLNPPLSCAPNASSA